ncbi:amidase [Paenibacillus thiaminolyticus]|uniref:amidase n=1 Tax=Paenibacillus thiaminolyticus TaxID=49283 RepID=UPI002175C267|nr:amidase [Paenibacillus thiaminolyticus]
MRTILESSLESTSLQYITALHRKEEYTKAFTWIFKQVDVLAAPTLPIPPRRIGVAPSRSAPIPKTSSMR